MLFLLLIIGAKKPNTIKKRQTTDVSRLAKPMQTLMAKIEYDETSTAKVSPIELTLLSNNRSDGKSNVTA